MICLKLKEKISNNNRFLLIGFLEDFFENLAFKNALHNYSIQPPKSI